MRILFVNEKGAFFGGVEQHIAHAARELTARGHECQLAFLNADGLDAAGFQSIFADTRQVPAMAGEAAYPGGRGWLARSWSELRFDVVYFHKVPQLPELQALPAHVRTVQMVHDHDLCCPRKHKYFAVSGRVCNRPAGWRCYLDAAFVARDREQPLGVRLQSISSHLREMRRHWTLDSLLVGSRWMRDELLMNGAPADRVEIVPPAVPSGGAVPPGVPEGDLVLYVGQLIRGKGVDRLLEAVARLEHPCRVVLAGQGNHESELRRLAQRHGIADRVDFRGWVAPADLGALYRAATVIAVPSRWPEPFGMVGLEAMHHARPVVGFDVGGIRDWLDDGRNGRLVPDGDIAAFALALGELLGKPGRARRMGLNGRLALDTRFSFPACIDTLETHLCGSTSTDIRRTA